MAQGINFQGGYNIKPYSKDIENIVRYTTGTSIAKYSPGPMEGMGMLLGMEMLMRSGKAANWIRDSYKVPFSREGLTKEALKAERKAASPFSYGRFKADSYKEAGTNIKNAVNKIIDNYKTDYKWKKQLFQEKGFNNASKTILRKFDAQTIINHIPDTDKMAELEKVSKKGKKAAEYYKKAKKMMSTLKAGNVSEAVVKDTIEQANKYFAKGEALSHGLIKPKGFFKKTGHYVGKLTGYDKVKGFIKNQAVKSPTLAKYAKYAKGSGAFVALEGGMALVMDVVPTFQKLGVKKGLKQTGKSAVKVAASVGGWVAGAKIGAAIGSFFGPGPGTFIGGVLGAACGAIGSWLAGKAADAVVGENELEIAKEEEAKQIAAQINQDPEATKQYIAAAKQRLKAEQGIENPDTATVIASINKITKELQEEAQAQNTNAVANPWANYNTKDIFANTNTKSNPFANNNPYDPNSYMNKDFMAMSAGLA